jgi:hypothetical protein
MTQQQQRKWQSIWFWLLVPNNDSPPTWLCPATQNPGGHLDAFSHVVKCIFLLQQDNVIFQALLDSWGESVNPCTLSVLLTVPLGTLQVTYGRTYDTQPLSNAYKNCITHFQNMYDHCSCQTTWSDHYIFDLTSSHFDSYCILISCNHDWSPPVLPLHYSAYAPACHQIPLVSPKCSDDGEESGALTGPEHLSQEPDYIHDETLMHPPILTWHTFM